MSATWDTLQIARDARLEGRDAIAAQLYAEVEPDFELGRCTVRRPCPPFILDEYAEEYEDRYEVGVQVAEHRARIESQDWLVWWNPLKTTSMDALLREIYSQPTMAQLAARQNASFAMLTKSRDSDGIEMRIKSYAQIIQPQWYGVFTGVD